MAHIVFEQSLREAQLELAALEEKFQELIQQRETLQSVVDSLGKYLRIAGHTQSLAIPAEDEQFVPRNGLAPVPAWAVARDILISHGTPMIVPDIHRVMISLGMSSKPDAIRIAMIRKPDIFHNFGNGRYGLTAWLDEVEDDPAEHFTLQEAGEATAHQ